MTKTVLINYGLARSHLKNIFKMMFEYHDQYGLLLMELSYT
ncbi:hypothetical protein L289_2698 [Acinetobacter gerneri DSM 14967 = CIP 107464 = MTCC 9824]|nr:hypothetical protein L289_2698 [Acinetobacter gerneri DSM 14967 = CIP 107464 = MTCC 9824]